MEASDLNTEVKLCAAILSRSSSTEGELLDALNKLRSQGSLPSRVLKETQIGLIVNRVSKESTIHSVRAEALHLKDSWREAFRASKSIASSPDKLARPSSAGSVLEGSPASKVSCIVASGKGRRPKALSSPACSESSSSSSSSSSLGKRARKCRKTDMVGLAELVPGWNKMSANQKKTFHVHMRDGAQGGTFSRKGAKWEWHVDDPCLVSVRAHLAKKEPLLLDGAVAVSELEEEGTRKSRKQDIIGLPELIPGWDELSQNDRKTIHTHLRDGSSNGNFHRAGARWEWPADDPCLVAVRAHLGKCALIKSRMPEGSVVASESDEEGLVAAPLSISKCVVDARTAPPLVEKIPRVSKSSASVRRLVTGSDLASLKEFSFVAEVSPSPDGPLFKHRPDARELRIRWASRGVSCSVCGCPLHRWIKVRCYRRSAIGGTIVENLRPEIFFSGRDECLWKLLGVDQGETRAQKLTRVLQEAILEGDTSELQQIFSESPVAVLMEIRRRLERSSRESTTAHSRQAGGSLGSAKRLDLAPSSRKRRAHEQNPSSAIEISDEEPQAKADNRDDEDLFAELFFDPPKPGLDDSQHPERGLQRPQTEPRNRRPRAETTDRRTRLQLVLDFLRSSAPDIFSSASASVQARQCSASAARSERTAQGSSNIVEPLMSARLVGSSGSQGSRDSLVPSTQNDALDLREGMIEALDKHFRKIGVSLVQQPPPQAAPKKPVRVARDKFATRLIDFCHDCSSHPSACPNKKCDFHCRNSWVTKYFSGESLQHVSLCPEHQSSLMNPEGDWEKGIGSQRLDALIMELGCWGFQESWCPYADSENSCLLEERIQKGITLHAADHLHANILRYVQDGASRLIPKYLLQWWEKELEVVRQMCCQGDADPDKFLGRCVLK